MGIERLFQSLRLHHIGVERGGVIDGIDVIRAAFLVDMHNEIETQFAHCPVPEGDHVLRLPPGIDVEQRKRRVLRPKRLPREMEKRG
jgi:hypothetical protein